MSNRTIDPHGNVTDILFIEYDGSNNPIYVCKAAAGTSMSSNGWQIKKITWSGSNATDVQFANGSPAYTFIADDRATYTYS